MEDIAAEEHHVVVFRDDFIPVEIHALEGDPEFLREGALADVDVIGRRARLGHDG